MKHAQDGMVNVRTNRLLTISRRELHGRGVQHNVETSASTMLNTDLMDKPRIHVRKRSRCPKQPPHTFGHVPLKRGLVEHAGMVPSIDVFPAVSSRAFRSEVTDDTVGTAAKRTRHEVPEVLAPNRDEHHTEGAIKTEMELVVSL